MNVFICIYRYKICVIYMYLKIYIYMYMYLHLLATIFEGSRSLSVWKMKFPS